MDGLGRTSGILAFAASASERWLFKDSCLEYVRPVGETMPTTDPIADLLTRIRNAISIRHETVTVPMSKMKLELVRILKEEGFIEDYQSVKTDNPRAAIKIRLHYRSKDEPGLNGLKRVSRPGLRVYVGKGEIPRYYGGLGVAILSTSDGVMTGKQAWRKGLGGELLCYVW